MRANTSKEACMQEEKKGAEGIIEERPCGLNEREGKSVCACLGDTERDRDCLDY